MPPQQHPIPIANPSITAQVQSTAGASVLVPLGGTASGGATIVSAWISALPSQGMLYQAHPNGTAATEAGTIALMPGGAPAALWRFAVVYMFSGAQGGSTTTSDNFRFIVGDDRNATSTPATAHVSLTPAPTPAPTQVQFPPFNTTGRFRPNQHTNDI